MYILVFSLWIFYFFLHSFLADFRVKNFFYDKIPVLKKYYRLVYVLISLVALPIILYLQIQIPDTFVIILPFWLKYVAYALALVGLIILYLAFKNYDTQEFLGLQQIQISEEKHTHLNTSGMNAWVRHPLYFGTLLVTIAWFLHKTTYANLYLSLIFIIYLVVGTILEEQKLIKIFGQAYKDYQKKVKMLIPFVF